LGRGCPGRAAEKLVPEYRSPRTPEEIEAYAQAGHCSHESAEEAFSNKIVTPGKTTSRQVSGWMTDDPASEGPRGHRRGRYLHTPSATELGPSGAHNLPHLAVSWATVHFLIIF
jgi:hypothetical protein